MRTRSPLRRSSGSDKLALYFQCSAKHLKYECGGGYNRQPFRFFIEYDRPKNKWRVLNFSLDDDIKDAARKALLPP